MRKGRSSGTAELVAGWRSLASLGFTTVPGFSDPLAGRLVRDRWARVTDGLREKLEQADPARRARLVDRYDHVIVRAACLDLLLRGALGAGVRQVVLLGAGLDTRAWRMPELAGTRLFEVDHPDTQAVKRTRSAALPAPHVAPIFVPVDFARDALADRLAAAGHDAAARTAWVWEGVVMYLPDAAVASTLAAVTARSAPGSELLLHYHTPSGWDGWSLLRRLLLGWIGEPQIGLREPAAVAALVRAAGLEVVEDLSLAAQAARVGARASTQPGRAVSRILVARRG